MQLDIYSENQKWKVGKKGHNNGFRLEIQISYLILHATGKLVSVCDSKGYYGTNIHILVPIIS